LPLLKFQPSYVYLCVLHVSAASSQSQAEWDVEHAGYRSFPTVRATYRDECHREWP